MKSIKEELAEILKTDNEETIASSLNQFLMKHKDKLPLPGESLEFDKIIWQATQYVPLSTADQTILKKVITSMEHKEAQPKALKLKDLVGKAKEKAISTWEDMLNSMAWQQLEPAAVPLRGAAAQTISLGTIQKQLGSTNIQLNLGWVADQEHLRILLQAKDKEEQALPDVELQVCETTRGIVFSRKTNQDGSIVAPSVAIEPGQYQIQVTYLDQMAKTPYFII